MFPEQARGFWRGHLMTGLNPLERARGIGRRGIATGKLGSLGFGSSRSSG